MILSISHATRYKFDAPVRYGLQQLRQTPKSYRAQSVLTWTTRLTGAKKQLEFDDYHRNRVELISLNDGVEELVIESEGRVEMADTHGIVGPHAGPAPLWLFARATPLTQSGRGTRSIVSQISNGEPLDRLHALSALIKDQIAYEVGASESHWTAEEAVAAAKGVCQDHTHVFITCARIMGFPARYSSGFLLLDDREEQEATHAWAEAHVDGLGWVGFDVSNGISPDERYVRVATGLDYSDAAPIRGVRMGNAEESLSVAVKVAQQ
ncbi:MAG: transglutaminase family protein [Pseudomonadota bacterium]